MSKTHTCINTAGGMIPPPCEACAEMPRCPHGGRHGMDKCDACMLVLVRMVVRDARLVAACFGGTGSQMVLSAPGRTLEDGIANLRASLAVLDKLGEYARADPQQVG